MSVECDISSQDSAWLLEADIPLLDKFEQSISKSGKEDKGRKLRCRVCEYVITDESQRIAVNDRHRYSRTNPHGVSFEFACFSEAIGCVPIGQPSDEASWFTLYSWQIVVCRECGEHLGWRFSGGEFFYGLITDRLVSDEDI